MPVYIKVPKAVKLINPETGELSKDNNGALVTIDAHLFVTRFLLHSPQLRPQPGPGAEAE